MCGRAHTGSSRLNGDRARAPATELPSNQRARGGGSGHSAWGRRYRSAGDPTTELASNQRRGRWCGRAGSWDIVLCELNRVSSGAQATAEEAIALSRHERSTRRRGQVRNNRARRQRRVGCERWSGSDCDGLRRSRSTGDSGSLGHSLNLRNGRAVGVTINIDYLVGNLTTVEFILRAGERSSINADGRECKQGCSVGEMHSEERWDVCLWILKGVNNRS